MNCPVCHKSLIELEKGCFSCPAGHGLLLSASKLLDSNSDFAEQVDKIEGLPTEAVSGEISCPNCSRPMRKVDYNSTGFIIDSCTNCHHRWFDSGELLKIKSYKAEANTSAEGLLFLSKFDYQNSQKTDRKSADLKAPGYHGALGGMVRGSSAANSRRGGAMLFMMVSLFAGLARAMKNSWFWRITAPLIIILVLLGMLYIVKAAFKSY